MYVPLNFDLMLANSLLILFLSASRDLPMESTHNLLVVYLCVVCGECVHATMAQIDTHEALMIQVFKIQVATDVILISSGIQHT